MKNDFLIFLLKILLLYISLLEFFGIFYSTIRAVLLSIWQSDLLIWFGLIFLLFLISVIQGYISITIFDIFNIDREMFKINYDVFPFLKIFKIFNL